MYWICIAIISATIPEGWPMLRANQQRTGYVQGRSCFTTDTPSVKWEVLVENSESAYIFDGPVAADFNANNEKDILIGIYKRSYPVADVFNGPNGAIIWRTAYNGGPKYGSPGLMDVNLDNIPEVFLHTNPLFRGLNGNNGTELWQNSSVAFGSYSGPLVIEGTTGAIVVGDDNGTLWCLNATDGAVVWSYSVGTYIQPPSFGEVDGNGVPEIVIVAGTKIYVFEMATGAPKWTVNTGDSATTPALANMDGDPQLEIVVYNYVTGRVRGYNYGTATPFMDVSIGAWTPQYTPNRTVDESWPCSPGLADITEDGTIDVVIHNGVTLYCINGASYGIEWANNETHLFGSPVIADLDSDGHLEIVCTGKPQPHYSSNYRLKVVMFEHTGQLKWRHACPNTLYPDPSLNEACLADVDADGDLEIVAVDYSCWLVVFDCQPIGAEEDTKPYTEMAILNTIFRDEIELILPSVRWVEYRIYDISGGTVAEGWKSAVEGKLRLDASEIGTGVYFLKVKTPEETRTFKVVKVL